MKRTKPIVNLAGYYYFKNYFPIFLFTIITFWIAYEKNLQTFGLEFYQGILVEYQGKLSFS